VKKTHRIALIVAVVVVALGLGAVTAYAALSDDNTPPATTSDGVATYWNSATITLTATDDTAVAYIYSHVDGDHEYTHLYVNPDTSGTGASVPVTVNTVGDHSLAFWAQDTAGNVEAHNTVSFTIKADKVAPTTAASGATGGAWYNKAVTLHLAATDNDAGSGVASISTTLDGGTPVVTAAPAADVSIPTTDGPHSVVFAATDVAGNVESDQTFTVNIDTVKPVAKAPSAASVARGKSVSLKYSVTDASPKANVSVQVKNSAGKIVKTLTAKGVTTNATHTVKLTVPKTWKAGAYKFYVTATDLAGNVSKAVSNKLTVK
jgi:Bacterial Ig-like domain